MTTDIAKGWVSIGMPVRADNPVFSNACTNMPFCFAIILRKTLLTSVILKLHYCAQRMEWGLSMKKNINWDTFLKRQAKFIWGFIGFFPIYFNLL